MTAKAALLAAVLTLVTLTVPPITHAEETCDTLSSSVMSPTMVSAYRLQEGRQYAAAVRAFDDASRNYVSCTLMNIVQHKWDDPQLFYWAAYGYAGEAASAFGAGNASDGLKWAQNAEKTFTDAMNHQDASAAVRRAAADGLAYVRSVSSTRQPLLPNVWRDWKAAHPGGGPSAVRPSQQTASGQPAPGGWVAARLDRIQVTLTVPSDMTVEYRTAYSDYSIYRPSGSRLALTVSPPNTYGNPGITVAAGADLRATFDNIHRRSLQDLGDAHVLTDRTSPGDRYGSFYTTYTRPEHTDVEIIARLVTQTHVYQMYGICERETTAADTGACEQVLIRIAGSFQAPDGRIEAGTSLHLGHVQNGSVF